MTKAKLPFPVPAKLTSDFDHFWVYWNSLKRGENKIPFSDDLDLSALPFLSDRLMLVDVFEKPQRFRFNLIGKIIEHRYGSNFSGKFADEIDPKGPLDFFTAQASATVEASAPTFFTIGDVKSENENARLLLPMWGNGRIDTILGGIARAAAE